MDNDSITSDENGRVVFGLVGTGGFAREVMPVAIEHLCIELERHPDVECKFYFVESRPDARQVNGLSVISVDEFLHLDCDSRYFNVAIGDSKVRERLSTEILMSGRARPLSLKSAHAISYHGNTIDKGAILCANTMITSNAQIGKFFHSNIYSYVAHDCVIGDFVTFAPAVRCNGNVHVHDHAYIGTGVVIKQGTPNKPLIIGAGAIVGMGAVVTKDVAPYTTVVGNPARLRAN